MLALPPAPAPARPRLLLVGAALASGAVVMMFAGMLGVYLHFRDQDGGLTTTWLPKNVVIPEVPANTLLAVMLAGSVLIQWAVYSIARNDRKNAALALGLTAVFGLAVVNAQAFIYRRMGMPLISVDGKRYNTLFYVVSGTLLVAVAVATLACVIAAFRALGGRTGRRDGEAVTAVAVYWHALSACTAAVWYILYVLK